jgi:hypothetical protein
MSPGAAIYAFSESYGWEAQILREGELVIGQRFVLREMAQAWAEAERQILKKGGA